MNAKKIWQSKTFWVNLISVIVIIVQGITGSEFVEARDQTIFLGVINIVLRLITKRGIDW